MPIRMRSDLFRDRYKSIEKNADFEIGDRLESYTGDEYEIVDMGVRFEEEEIMFWLERVGTVKSTRVEKEGELYAWDKVGEGEGSEWWEA